MEKIWIQFWDETQLKESSDAHLKDYIDELQSWMKLIDNRIHSAVVVLVARQVKNELDALDVSNNFAKEMMEITGVSDEVCICGHAKYEHKDKGDGVCVVHEMYGGGQCKCIKFDEEVWATMGEMAYKDMKEIKEKEESEMKKKEEVEGSTKESE